MTCREFVEFLDAYIDSALPAARRAIFDRHLAVCAECQAYLDSYRLTIAASKQLAGDGDVPAEVPEDLIAAILRARAD